MNTTAYWIIAFACAVAFSLLVEWTARTRGTRGLVGGTLLVLIVFELLAYIDWRRDIEAPLIGYVLIAGVPTLIAALGLAFMLRRTQLSRLTTIALSTGVWVVAAIAVLRAWPRL